VMWALVGTFRLQNKTEERESLFHVVWFVSLSTYAGVSVLQILTNLPQVTNPNDD
jgi:hypothetical protein